MLAGRAGFPADEHFAAEAAAARLWGWTQAWRGRSPGFIYNDFTGTGRPRSCTERNQASQGTVAHLGTPRSQSGPRRSGRRVWSHAGWILCRHRLTRHTAFLISNRNYDAAISN
jgi:hypothetical protein